MQPQPRRDILNRPSPYQHRVPSFSSNSISHQDRLGRTHSSVIQLAGEILTCVRASREQTVQRTTITVNYPAARRYISIDLATYPGAGRPVDRSINLITLHVGFILVSLILKVVSEDWPRHLTTWYV